MYTCLLLKRICKDKDNTEDGIILLKYIDLDFVPFEGLCLDSGDAYASIGKINSVTYALEANAMSYEKGFRLEASDEFPYWSELFGRVLELEDLLKIYKDSGWREYSEMYSPEGKNDDN